MRDKEKKNDRRKQKERVLHLLESFLTDKSRADNDTKTCMLNEFLNHVFIFENAMRTCRKYPILKEISDRRISTDAYFIMSLLISHDDFEAYEINLEKHPMKEDDDTRRIKKDIKIWKKEKGINSILSNAYEICSRLFIIGCKEMPNERIPVKINYIGAFSGDDLYIIRKRKCFDINEMTEEDVIYDKNLCDSVVIPKLAIYYDAMLEGKRHVDSNVKAKIVEAFARTSKEAPEMTDGALRLYAKCFDEDKTLFDYVTIDNIRYLAPILRFTEGDFWENIHGDDKDEMRLYLEVL